MDSFTLAWILVLSFVLITSSLIALDIFLPSIREETIFAEGKVIDVDYYGNSGFTIIQLEDGKRFKLGYSAKDILLNHKYRFYTDYSMIFHIFKGYYYEEIGV